MKALQITGYGDIQKNLRFNAIEKPKVKSDEVLIEVYAAAINPVDYKIVEGALKQIRKLKFPSGTGFDVAGIVVETGDAVTGLNIGDKVYSRVPTDAPGTFAEYVSVVADAVSIKPANLSFEEAAGLPLVGLTSMQAFETGAFKKGDKVLIHAGSGGIGSFAIQYAKSQGAFVYTTTSTKNVNWVKELGADKVINYKKQDYLGIVRDADLVFDTLGGHYTEDAFKVIKEGGHVVSIAGILDKVTAKNFGLNGIIRFILALKRLPVTIAMKRKSAHYKFIFVHPDGKQLDALRDLVEAGKIKPVIDKIYDFSEAIDAYHYQKSGHAKGKVILKMK
ncbi:NADP-dependent oxidoreductase [Gaetbulibacter aestuarii]|uniref:NADP-dependent oxidoreductase n=1 Tax=Gaetbulibacter aestuarii TaxID=1502358 RepID=A0ABW7MV57_9FLAO